MKIVIIFSLSCSSWTQKDNLCVTNKLLYDFKEKPDSLSPHSLSLHEKNGQDILQKFTFVFHSRKSFRLEQREDEKMMTGVFVFG